MNVNEPGVVVSIPNPSTGEEAETGRSLELSAGQLSLISIRPVRDPGMMRGGVGLDNF